MPWPKGKKKSPAQIANLKAALADPVVKEKMRSKSLGRSNPHHWSCMGKRPTALLNAQCQVCGGAFHVKPSVLKKGKGLTCSSACSARRRSAVYRGENHPLWKGGAASWDRSGSGVEKVCLGCGETFVAVRKRINYCTLECHHRSTAKRGEENPNWAGGRKPRRSADYSNWHAAVLRRDNFTCQKCGVRGGRLHAHHIRSWIRYPETRLDVSNGLTLCGPCHFGTHRGEGHAHAKLTEDKVRQILSDYAQGGVTQKELGRCYGVSESQISLIVRGRSWKNIDR